ncbi:50S ribosomal protein L18 [Candidatus Woesearchaeota archaeon CG10_big_fil_rev_8_21_14_0_10_37_12]|nr:MAG: 50S ribosomal protein L18 [Candidatus Woesearchaeota archaeon CG10_big_fil_rev_8_21_14_0_10_37_12]
MATNNKYTVQHRRKREGKTNYKVRMKLLSGHKPRLVIRKSLKHIQAQIVEFNPSGDKVVISAHTKELAKYGWKGSNCGTNAAYLTGLLLGKKAKNKTCVLDIGQYTSVKGCVLYALVQGATDAGLKIPCSKEVIPSKQRIRGEHVAAYAKQLKTDKDKYSQQFATYIKKGLDPETLPNHFDEIKKKIEAQ